MTGLQLGYESRCAAPHAFDVDARFSNRCRRIPGLVEQKLNGVMVSVGGNCIFALCV